MKIPPENLEERARLQVTLEDIDKLHELALAGSAPWPLYHAAGIAHRADRFYLEGAKDQGCTIARLRWWLTRAKTRRFIDQERGEEVIEEVSYRFWPVFDHIVRTRTSLPLPTKLTVEVELAYRVPIDLDALWRRQRPNLQKDAIELMQSVLGNGLLEMLFLPEKGLSYRVTISYKGRRKSALYPLAQHYEPLLRRAAKDYRLVVDKSPRELDKPLQEHSSDELSEALEGFWNAVKTYDPDKRIPPPVWFKRQVSWKLGEEFDRQSVPVPEALREESESDGPVPRSRSKAKRPPRALRTRIEHSGGSLDAPISDEDDAPLLHETLPSEQPTPDVELEVREEQRKRHRLGELAKELFIAELGQEFFHLRYEELKTYVEIAKILKRGSPDAARKRDERAKQTVRDKLLKMGKPPKGA